MKKLLVPTLCVFVGCAAGAMIPAVTAQWSANPQAQRWQQECVALDGSMAGRRRDSANEHLRARGAEGWEAFSADVGNATLCFKRPAP